MFIKHAVVWTLLAGSVCVCLYLFECQRLGLLLAGPCLPHTDGGAGATSDDQFGVGTDGTEDLTPLGQTLVHHQRLQSAQQIIGGAQSWTPHLDCCCASSQQPAGGDSSTSGSCHCKAQRCQIEMNLQMVPNLVGLVIGQAAAKVGVAPGKGLAPSGRDQNLVLLHCQDALVSAHNLSHGLLQL